MSENILYEVNFPSNAFEGASSKFLEEQNALLNGEADTLAAREVLLLQMRTAHAIRNNGYAKTAADKYVTSLGGIRVNWKNKKGKKHVEMQDYWDEFAEDPNLDGQGTLFNTQSVWHYSMFQSGNAFTRLQIRQTDKKVPLKLQGIPAELHDVGLIGQLPNFAQEPDLVTRNGITFRDTKPISYYFRKDIYESYFNNISNPWSLNTIPADEILHLFIRQHPGQWIGIPFLASVLIALYSLDELTDATIAKQKAAQAIAWIIENTNPINPVATGRAISGKDQEGNPKVQFKAQGGNTQYLNKGEKLTQVQAGDIGQNLPVLIRSELQRICSSVGIPYHSITGDTSGLNFSSIRAIAVELRNRIEYIHHFYTIPCGMAPLAKYFKSLAVLQSKTVNNAFPSFQLPRWRGIDDLKDAQADILEYISGIGTLQGILDERHLTFEDIIADRKMMQEAGLGELLVPKNASMAQAGNTDPNSNSSSN